MKYVIYDTNEYIRMIGGRPDLSFEMIDQNVALLHQSERRLGLTPIFNTTVAFELIQHLNSSKPDDQEKYIRACYALYIHCCNPIVCITKNPYVAYIEEKTGNIIIPTNRTLNFLKALSIAPTAQTIAENKDFIIEVENYLRDLKADFLANLQVLRNQYKNDDKGKKEFLHMVDSREYLQYRANTFLCSICQACKKINIMISSQSLSGMAATKAFIKTHRVHIEMWRIFDRDYGQGRYNLKNLKTANTGLDAEICYYAGARIDSCSIGVVSEERLFHQSARKALLGNLVLSIGQVREGNKINMMIKDLYYSIAKKVRDFVELQMLLLV